MNSWVYYNEEVNKMLSRLLVLDLCFTTKRHFKKLIIILIIDKHFTHCIHTVNLGLSDCVEFSQITNQTVSQP